MADLNISFAASGDGRKYLQDGWSSPEDEFTWAIGSGSTLSHLPTTSASRQLLIIDLFPFQPRNGPLTAKRLKLKIGGRILWSGEISRHTTLKIVVPPGVAAANGMEFVHPDCERPSSHGENDDRMLAFALRSVRIRELVPAPPSKPIEVTADGSNVDRYIERVISDIARTKCGAAAQTAGLLSSRYGVTAVVVADDGLGDDFSVIKLAYTPESVFEFRLSSKLANTIDVDAARLAIKHWLFTMPLFAAFHAASRTCGDQRLSLGDEAHGPGLSFCNQSGKLLLPDPIFLSSRAYRQTRWRIEGNFVDWHSRINTAVWRGSTTGYRKHPDVRQLDRVKLCELSRATSSANLLDAGITQLVQLRSDEERSALESLGIIREYMPIETFSRFKYTVDIDGNTNSWPGLFTKLLTGSVVLKVTSSSGWRQWYYDRLNPFEHFVPVRSDLADLTEKIEWLRSNDNMAHSIGQRGRELALSMRFTDEVERGCATIEQSFIDDF